MLLIPSHGTLTINFKKKKKIYVPKHIDNLKLKSLNTLVIILVYSIHSIILSTSFKLNTRIFTDNKTKVYKASYCFLSE